MQPSIYSPSELPTILVVEDDVAARELLSEMLTILGYRSTCVATAEDAVAKLDAATANYVVLLADIDLPGMSGIELASYTVAQRPSMRIIFATGFGFLVADKTDFEFALLPKPYDLNQLQHVVASAIELALPKTGAADKV